MKQNVASQSIGAEMITAADGTAFTGTVTVVITIDNGTQSASGGTAPAHEGNGYHSYTPTQAETNGNHIAFTFTGTGAIPATVQVFTAFPQTVDNDVLASGTTGFTAIDTVVDAILVDTAAMQPLVAKIPLSDGVITWNSTALASINAEADTALTDYDPPTNTEMVAAFTEIKGATWATTDSLEAIRDRGDAAWTTGAGGNDRLLMVDTTIATLATQTSFTLTAGSTDDDAYNNLSIVVEDVATSTQKAVGMVLDYTGSTKTVTLKEALAFTIAATDKIYILAENSLKSTVANRQLDVTATGAAGIDWANVENPTTTLDLSGTDIQLVDTATTVTGGATAASIAALNDVAATDIVSAGAITTLTGAVVNVDLVDTCTTNTDQRGTDSALLAASINLTAGAVDTVTTCTTTTTNTDMRGTDSALLAASINLTGGAVDNVTTVATTTTNTDMVAEPTTLLTTQMTEAYAADNVDPTVAQCLFMIQQTIGDFSISGTTITTKKIDGSTTASTYTLDDGTNPTSRTRAT